MSIESGFFNSVNGDRVYSADDINNFFKGVLDDGIFKNYDGDLAVTAGSGLSVNVDGGKAIVFSKYVQNTGVLNLQLTASDTLPRYDAVVVGVDLESRTGGIYVKTGTPGVAPSYPPILNTDSVKELCLAYVYVAALSTAVASTDIVDKRSDPSVCGYVKLTNFTAHLDVIRNNQQLAGTNIQSIPVGISSYDASSDSLFVYLNGMLLSEAVDYTVAGTGSLATIEFVNPIATGSSNMITTVVHRITD